MPRFTADDLIDCYRRGVFPMADARHDARVFLVEPARRGIIPLDGFRISRRLARTVRSDRFSVRLDTAFGAVIEGCAAPRPGRMETWINRTIETLCLELFTRGRAHSIETTIPLFQDLLQEPDIIEGRYDIHWLERWIQDQG